MNEKVVYQVLASHQQAEEDWELRGLLVELLRWAKKFNFEFKLEIPEISLTVDRLRRKQLGHFRRGHNGFGLKGEIAINRRHLQREFWQILGTLLHELLHAWQQAHGKAGKRNYHNREFRKKAQSLGLIVDQRGVTGYERDEKKSPFLKTLKRYGIQIPELPEPIPATEARGSSKLKKWSCGCTNVRVAVTRFEARCLVCGNVFRKVE